MKNKLLFTDTEWTSDLISKTWDTIEKVAKEVCPPIDYYNPQIEIISAEQMLDAYSSVAMPLMYKHWSFGKEFVRNEQAYKKGKMGLAYEVVINTDPCLVYLMEDNTMTLQTLVMAHAGVGHSGFFKNNYLFKMWTHADTILNYLNYAKNFIESCEKRYGVEQVEAVLSACHAIKYYSVDKCKRQLPNSKKEIQQREAREEYNEKQFNDLWRTLPKKDDDGFATMLDDMFDRMKDERAELKTTYFDLPDAIFPEENLLYFIEKYSANHAKSAKWIKEICSIVRTISQYFYPQMQTQIMNEGYATFTHYTLMTALHEKGYINEGSYLEFLYTHSAVLYQPSHASPHFNGINPYALGFAMFQDIKRICENPTAEDKKWFPTIVNTDWKEVIADIVKNYRDESFILQFLSPKVIRDFNFFTLLSTEKSKVYTVTHTQDDEDVVNIRRQLAQEYDLSYRTPHIEIKTVDWLGEGENNGTLVLQYHSIDGKLLDYEEAKQTSSYVTFLWGGPVIIYYVGANGEAIERVKI